MPASHTSSLSASFASAHFPLLPISPSASLSFESASSARGQSFAGSTRNRKQSTTACFGKSYTPTTTYPSSSSSPQSSITLSSPHIPIVNSLIAPETCTPIASTSHSASVASISSCHAPVAQTTLSTIVGPGRLIQPSDGSCGSLGRRQRIRPHPPRRTTPVKLSTALLISNTLPVAAATDNVTSQRGPTGSDQTLASMRSFYSHHHHHQQSLSAASDLIVVPAGEPGFSGSETMATCMTNSG
ncbi:unnamed protein product [Protopolystoma xenopodis]|uniref:Uncharacterized protein n=1 Tax=Protopolystoma xenopodis TaxID=117903 RepID=A0A3S5C719_9PLAT|nr:unnamed protein product [Protopolystoma xenopodis]